MRKDSSDKKEIKLPLTKSQKLKRKHIYLILFIVFLIVVLISLLLISDKDENKIAEKSSTTTTTKIKQEKINIYDIESNKRPYAVMIPNDSGAKKRQYGLQNAYLIYEITVEGGITRLLALYKDIDVERIGPVRSSRHYYLDYALENDAIYVHFGWSPQAQSDIETLKINNLNGLYNPSNMFWRDKKYSSPNNAFTSTENIKKAAENKKYRLESNNYQLLNYKSKVTLEDESKIKANNVKVYYTNNVYVKYVYDETNKYYLRYNNENKHIDLSTNEQIHMKNILVLKMDTNNISGDDKGRQNLNNIGSGEGYYITEGNSIKITWEKQARDKKTIFKDLKGKEIEINDGNTFIQIQPTSKKTIIE